FSWSDKLIFDSRGDQVFYSIFHSISAFNTAGFSLFTNGLNEEIVKDNYLFHNIVSLLIFIGALGFIAIFDIFSLKKIRERIKFPWKSLQFGTKIALYFSIGLVVVGTVAFYILEGNNTLANEENVFVRISHS